MKSHSLEGKEIPVSPGGGLLLRPGNWPQWGDVGVGARKVQRGIVSMQDFEIKKMVTP